MSRPIPKEPLERLLSIVAKHGGGVSLDDVVKAYGGSVPMRTVQYWLTHLVEHGAVQRTPGRRYARYTVTSPATGAAAASAGAAGVAAGVAPATPTAVPAPVAPAAPRPAPAVPPAPAVAVPGSGPAEAPLRAPRAIFPGHKIAQYREYFLQLVPAIVNNRMERNDALFYARQAAEQMPGRDGELFMATIETFLDELGPERLPVYGITPEAFARWKRRWR